MTSEIEELLNTKSNMSVRTVNPETEPHIIVGTDRIIRVPEDLKRIAVQNDNKIETVTFDCPRYWDNHDLSEMNIFINYLRPNGAKGVFLAKNVRINAEDENLINFEWIINDEISIYEGEIKMLIAAKKIVYETEEEMRWYSEINNQMRVSKGIDNNESVTGQYPDIINDLLTKMDTIIIADTPILDKSLNISGLAADSKAAGDAIRNTGKELNDKLDIVNTKIQTLAQGGPKAMYSTVNALKTANPETGIYLVSADGHIYSWTKNQTGNPIDLGVYQATINTNMVDALINTNKYDNYLIDLYDDFIQGGYDTTTWGWKGSGSRISLQNLQYSEYDIYLQCNDDYRIAIETWKTSDNTDPQTNHNTDSGWVTEYRIPKHTYFTILMCNKNGMTSAYDITPEEAINLYGHYIKDNIENLKNDIGENYCDILTPGFIDGVYGHLRSPAESTKERTTKLIKVEPGDEIIIFGSATGTTLWSGIAFYKDFLKDDSIWSQAQSRFISRITSDLIVYDFNENGKKYSILKATVPLECKYVKCSFRQFEDGIYYVMKNYKNNLLYKEFMDMINIKSNSKNISNITQFTNKSTNIYGYSKRNNNIKYNIEKIIDIAGQGANSCQSIVTDFSNKRFINLVGADTARIFDYDGKQIGTLTKPSTGHDSDNCYINGDVYIVGATTQSEAVSKLVYKWNIENNTVTQLDMSGVINNPNANRRVVGGICETNPNSGKLYIVCYDSNNTTTHNANDRISIYEYTISNGNITLKNDLLPFDCIYIQGATCLNGLLYIYCNTQIDDASSYHNGVTIKVLDTKSWEMIDEIVIDIPDAEPESANIIINNGVPKLLFGVAGWSDVKAGVYTMEIFKDPYEIQNESEILTHKINLPISRGTYYLSSNTISTNWTRVSLSKDFYADTEQIIHVNNGYKMYVYCFDSSHKALAIPGIEEWRTKDFYIPKNVYYRVVFARIDDSSFEGNNVNVYNEFTNNCFIHKYKNAENELLLNKFESIDKNMFIKGTYSESSHNVVFTTDTRLITKVIYNSGNGILIRPDDGVKLQVFYFRDDYSLEKNATNGWITDEFKIEKNKKYLLLLSYNDNSSITDENDLLSKYNIYYINNDNFELLKQQIQNESEIKKDIIYYNEDAINSVVASKMHFDTNITGQWGSSNYSNLFTIAHISDLHTDWDRYNNFIKFTDKYPNIIDERIVTGDLVSRPTDEQINSMNMHHDKVLMVVGNHDRAEQTVILSSDNIYSKFRMNTNTGKTYYYKDYNISHNKIRLIVLDQFDIITNNVSVASTVMHYSQDQIDWFIDTLKDAKTNGYSVLIGMHSPETFPDSNDKKFYQRFYRWTQANARACNGTPIEDIIDAFKRGVTINKTYTYNDDSDILYVNTSFSGAGSFLAYMVGHYHGDFVGYSPNYNNQLYLCVTCGCLYPNFLSTANYGELVSDLSRRSDTKSQDAFNIYTFDIAKKQVKVVRIGANQNDQMKMRDYDIYDL